MDLGIAGQVAIVGGASRGIGRAVATALAGEGARVALAARGRAELDELAAEIAARGGQAAAFPCDLVDADAALRLARDAEARLGAAQILVVAAAVTAPYAGLAEAADGEFERVALGNLAIAGRMARAVLPGMRAGGRIVFVGSLAGEVGGAGQTGYAAAKAGLLGLARSLALEVARGGITVNVVVPGAIDTARLRAAVGDERRAALARGSPLRRLGQPEEVAAAVLWLASRQAAFVTGAAIPVTGGFELGV